MMTPMRQDEILERLLRDTEVALEPDPDYCLLTALKGSNYGGDFYFCGRAGNGWWNQFCRSEIDSHDGRMKIVDRALSPIDGLTCSVDPCFSKTAPCTGDPLHWVHHTRTDKSVSARKSAFFRVVGKTVKRFYGAAAPETWSSLLVWSDLYKVGPGEKGNPPAALLNAQFPAAVELLRWELMEYRPRWAIFLTELDAQRGWFTKFRDHLAPESYASSTLPYISATGVLRLEGHPITAIVAQHPQGRREEAFAESLLKIVRG